MPPKQSEPSEKKSFWTTLPGILTGIAAVLTALGALIAALGSAGLVSRPESTPPAPPPVVETAPAVTTTGDRSPVVTGTTGDVTIDIGD
jgi:hypothetical protein